MENKMYAKSQYKCAICGQIFDELRERVNCETVCLKKQEEEAKKAAELKKKAEQASREAEVDEAFAHAFKLRDAFVKDYGYYEYEHNVTTNIPENDDEWPSLKALLHFLP